METPQLLSPKQVAVAIGVSESSLKRWCDKGIISATRTAGGHRRMTRASVVSFLRTSGQPVPRPEILGLPTIKSFEATDSVSLFEKLTEAFVQGEANTCREIIIGSFVQGQSLSLIFDQTIKPVFHHIGKMWVDGRAQIFEERRAVEICMDILRELKMLIPEPEQKALIAVGGTPQDDNYQIAPMMVDLLLRHLGWESIYLGCNLPFETLAKAAQKYSPNLFWISVTNSVDEQMFAQQLSHFKASLPPSVGLIVGGQAVSHELQVKVPNVVFGENLQKMETFLRTMASVREINSNGSNNNGSNNSNGSFGNNGQH